jgi:hypothetical protein
MLAVTLTILTLVSIMFFFIGGMLGWMAKQHFYERSYISSIHPEMFDTNGNVIPDEIIAVRFENDYDDYDEEDDDE